MTENPQPHILSTGLLVSVWLVLLGLTGLTLLVARVNLGIWNVWAALGIASLKAGLVIAFFMHMKYEGRLLRLCLFAALLTLAVFIGFTFFDIRYR